MLPNKTWSTPKKYFLKKAKKKKKKSGAEFPSHQARPCPLPLPLPLPIAAPRPVPRPVPPQLSLGGPVAAERSLLPRSVLPTRRTDVPERSQAQPGPPGGLKGRGRNSEPRSGETLPPSQFQGSVRIWGDRQKEGGNGGTPAGFGVQENPKRRNPGSPPLGPGCARDRGSHLADGPCARPEWAGPAAARRPGPGVRLAS